MTHAYWIGILVIVTVDLALLGVMVWRPWRRREAARMVFCNLDSARENGYFEPGEHLHGLSPDEVAHDMTCHAPDCEGEHPEKLVPYVREWLNKEGLVT